MDVKHLKKKKSFLKIEWFGLVFMVFNATFNNISVISVSFIGGGNWRTWSQNH
jgi:hypothetical protein